jgi:outer membrane protein assembly factor BamB
MIMPRNPLAAGRAAGGCATVSRAAAALVGILTVAACTASQAAASTITAVTFKAVSGAPVTTGAAAPAHPATAHPVTGGTGAASCPTATWAAEVTDAGRVAWKVPLPSSPTEPGGASGPLVINGVALFAGNSDLTALRPSDGHRLWQIHIPADGNPLPDSFWKLWQWGGTAIALINQSTSTKISERLVAINPATGKVRWSLRLGGAVESATQIAEDGVIALAVGDKIQAVGLTGGNVLWSRKFGTPDKYGDVDTQLAMAGDYVVAAVGATSPGATTGTAAGFDNKGGTRLWTRTGIPAQPFLAADGWTALLYNGYDNSSKSTAFPMTALSPETGQTLWHIPVKDYVDAVWTTPADVIFAAPGRMYDADPATGLRWSVPALPDDALVTATDVIYLQDKETSPTSPIVTDMIDRRLRDAKIIWQHPVPASVLTSAIVAPAGPDFLVATSASNINPETEVYVRDLRTGKPAAATATLPSDVLTSPAVTGADAIFQLNPWVCISG